MVNGNGDVSPILIFIITSPAHGKENQKEHTTQIYPRVLMNMLFVFGDPKVVFHRHCTKSSMVIATACHMK